MSAISIDMPVSSRLQYFFRTPLGRWVLFSVYNVPTALIGAGLFYTEVHYLGQNKFLMHCANFLPVTVMTFCVNSQVPGWKGRKRSKKGFGCWSGYSLGKWGISQLLFILLAGAAALPYMWVSQSQVIALGVVSYFVNDRKVFPKQEETANGARSG